MSESVGQAPARSPDGRGVDVLVRGAARRLAWARGADVLLVSVAAGLTTASAAVLSGARLHSLESWGPALLCALLAGLTVRLARPIDRAQLALKLDEELAQKGLFASAWEAECSRGDEPLVQLLVRRARLAVSPARVRRACPSRSLPLVVLPFLAGALLGTSLDRMRATGREPLLEAAARTLVAGLGDVLEHSIEDLETSRITTEDYHSLAEKLRQGQQLAAGIAQAAAREGGATAEDLAAAEAELEELREMLGQQAEELSGCQALRELLDRARIDADAALMAAEEGSEGAPRAGGEPRAGAASPGEEPGTRTPAGASPGADSPPAAAADSPAGGESFGISEIEHEPDPSGLRAGPGDGKMNGSASASAGADSPSAPGGPVPTIQVEPASAGGTTRSWWPARHARLIERWVESRRSEATDTPPR